MIAAEHGQVDIGEALIAGDANLNTQDVKGQTALMYAANGRHFDFVELLLSEGALTYIRNSEKETALDIARAASHGEIVNLLSQAA